MPDFWTCAYHASGVKRALQGRTVLRWALLHRNRSQISGLANFRLGDAVPELGCTQHYVLASGSGDLRAGREDGAEPQGRGLLAR